MRSAILLLRSVKFLTKVLSPLTSCADSDSSFRIVSDPLGLGDLRNGGNVCGCDPYVFLSEDEYIIDNDSFRDALRWNLTTTICRNFLRLTYLFD